MENFITNTEHKEKKGVAISSVVAAFFLTGTKLVVGLLTGSLGILSEALHSALDLVAAFLTLFAIKIADKPADQDHQFGHGKVENVSALFQTLLLLATSAWVIWEAIERIITRNTDIEVNAWSYIVIIVAIVIDFSRSRALSKYAKKYNSQALEADALHFSTDILSSFVVLLGLIASSFNHHIFDSIAGLIVALIVIYISFRLGKASIDNLIDKTPVNVNESIRSIASNIVEIQLLKNVRTRQSGSIIQAEMTICVEPKMNVFEAHEVADRFEGELKNSFKKIDINIHIEPFIV